MTLFCVSKLENKVSGRSDTAATVKEKTDISKIHLIETTKLKNEMHKRSCSTVPILGMANLRVFCGLYGLLGLCGLCVGSARAFICLSRGYTCDFLLAMPTWHPQRRSEKEVECGRTCSQVSPISATCCKKLTRWIFCNIVPAILSQNLPQATRATLWFHSPCNIIKKRHVASASKNIPRVAAASRENELALASCEI